MWVFLFTGPQNIEVHLNTPIVVAMVTIAVVAVAKIFEY